MTCDLTRSLMLLGPSNRSAEDSAALNQHLTQCPACAALASREAHFDTAVRQAMTEVPIPAGLHERLLRNAFATRGRLLRRKFYQALTLAAIAVVGVFIAQGVAWRLRPAPDSRDLVNQIEHDRDFPEQAVADWLASLGLPQALPLDFDFQHESMHGLVELQGRQVPMIAFKRDQDFAHVYILQEQKIDTGKLVNTQNSRTAVLVIKDAKRRDITYLIIHSEDLKRLLRNVNMQLS